MLLSIIITHYKTLHLLEICLNSLKDSESKIDKEIIVCDSEFLEKTKEIMEKKYKSVRYLYFKNNVGYGRLVNAGIKEAKGDYYLILNADIITNFEGIKKMIEYMKNNPQVGILGPKLINIDGSFQPSCFRWYNFWTILARRTSFGKTKYGKKVLSYFLMEDYNKKEPREVPWVMGSAFLTTRAAISKVGGMDNRFFMYFEDVDLCQRMWLNGFKVVYFPYATFIHHHIRSSDTKGGIFDIFKNRLTRIHIASYIKYSLKWMFHKRPNF